MKTFHYIFKFIIGVIIASTIINTAVGQSIKTPKNQTVYTEYNWDSQYLLSVWENQAASWIFDHSSNATRLSGATSNYNCHSWAWHVSDGGSSSNSWINYTHNGGANLSKYWTNDAYSPGSPYEDNCKIFYGTSADHSAIMTTTSGVVTSKWGAWPRYSHTPTDCPYDASNLQYYRVPIIGDDIICAPKTYLTSNIPDATYSWSSSTNLSTTGTDYSTTVTRTSEGEGGWIHCQISSPYSGTVISSIVKDVQIGVHNITVYSEGGDGGYVGNSFIFWVNPVEDGDEIEWSVYPGGIITEEYGTYNDYSLIYFDTPGHYYIMANVVNSCGTGSIEDHEFQVNEYFLLSPNPASTEVTITLNKDKSANVASNKIYDISILDMYGILKSQNTYSGDSFQIPVYNLKNGNYFVKIKNGNTIVTKKLIIKH
jgi:hypothetical protein